MKVAINALHNRARCPQRTGAPADDRRPPWPALAWCRNLMPACCSWPVLLRPLIGLLLRGVLEVPGLGNYEQLFANSAYARVLLNTFSVAGLVTLISLLLGFPLAWAITLVPRAGAAGS
jgi:putative spermidine/putrescine transport system permease protein